MDGTRARNGSSLAKLNCAGQALPARFRGRMTIYLGRGLEFFFFLFLFFLSFFLLLVESGILKWVFEGIEVRSLELFEGIVVEEFLESF